MVVFVSIVIVVFVSYVIADGFLDSHDEISQPSWPESSR